MESDTINARLLNGKEQGDEDEVELLRRILDEMKKLWIVAGPAIFSRFSIFGIFVITQAFIGHIGAVELAAYALSQNVLLRLANGVLLGMASALETLCGQAYGGQQYHMLGIYLQRSWIVLTICAIVLLPIFTLSAPLLKSLGQEDDIANVAGYVSLWFIPMLFGFVVLFTCQIYLQSQSRNKIVTYFAAAAIVIHVFFSWLLVVKYNWGLPGALFSTVLASWIPNAGLLIFIICGWCPDTWKGFSWLAFKDLWPVIRLSLSSGVMVCLEMWYNSILLLLTGNMANANVAIDALSICLNINGWTLMISFGFLAAVGVRVSNELGRGSSKAAKISVVVALITSLSIGLVLFVLFLLFQERLAYIFTNSEEVAAATSQLTPLLVCSILLNAVQPVLSGVAVGAGWQGIVAYVNIVCYYLIGIPLGVVLGYLLQFEVTGIWVGMLIGTAVQTIVLLVITWRTDWDKQVDLAEQRVKKWFVPESEETNGYQITEGV